MAFRPTVTLFTKVTPRVREPLNLSVVFNDQSTLDPDMARVSNSDTTTDQKQAAMTQPQLPPVASMTFNPISIQR